MVGALGLGDSLISYDAADMGNGADVVAKVIASDAARAATEEILEDSKDRVTEMLERNRHFVEALRDALLDREELVSEEILDVLATAATEHEDQVLDLR
jgi:ATP-dependent Zn protease